MDKLRILIVEDEAIIAISLEHNLRSLGHTVCAKASSGAEAIEHVKAEMPDLILMDISLNGNKDGIETAIEIKSMYPIPIIYLSAYSDRETVRRAKASMPFGYLVKPIDFKELEILLEMAAYKLGFEEQIRVKDNQSRAVIDSIHDPIFLVDSEGTIIEHNNKANTIAITGETSFVGKNFFALNGLFAQNDYLLNLDKSLRSAQPSSFVLEYQGRWYDNQIYPVSVQPDRPKASIVIRDVTAQKKKDLMIAESEVLFRSLFERSVDPQVLIQGSYIIDCNDSALSLFAVPTKSKLLNHKISDFAPEYQPDGIRSIDKYSEEINRAYNLGFGNFEWTQFSKSGKIITLEITCTNIVFHGTVILYTTLRDITEKKRAEQYLLLNDRRMQDILEMSNMADRHEVEIMSFALDSAVKITNSRFGFVATMNENEDIISIKSFSVNREPQVFKHTLIISATEAGLLSKPITERKPLILNEIETDLFKDVLPKNHIELKNLVLIPVFDRNKIVMLIALANKHYDFEDSDIQHTSIIMSTLWRLLSRKRAESERYDLEEKNRQIINNASEFIALITSDGIVSLFNNSLAKALGGAPADFEGKPFDEVLPAEAIAQMNTALAVLQETGEGYAAEYSTAISGTDYFLKTNFQPLKDESGIVHSVLCVSTDITGRVRAEEALEFSEKTMKAILAASPVGICLANRRKISWSNKYFAKMIGFEDVIDETFEPEQLFKSPKEFEEAVAPLGKQLAENGYGEIETQFICANGTILDVLLMARPLDEHENTKGHIVAFMDITERKQLEREFVRMMEMKLETEKQRNEISAIVANSARIASIGVIASGITHEINQPLNAIRIASDGILSWDKQNNSVLPAQISKLIQRVSDAAIRIDSIIKHMRSFWVDPAKQELDYLELNQLIDKTLSIVEQRIFAHQIELVREFSNESPIVKANEVQLEIVLSNLILNALNSLDLINKPSKLIKISTYNFGKECYLEVSDNGPGLPDIDTKQLFDPFFSTRQNSGGTGLGLAIVKMFTDRFGARVTAFNNADTGATFRIVFPTIDETNIPERDK